MFNKKKCRKCKYHSYVGHAVQRGEYTGDYRDNQVVCFYSIRSKSGHGCLHRVGKEVIDRRGTDPENCKLFEEGEMERDKQWFQDYY